MSPFASGLADAIFQLSPVVRYVALYERNTLSLVSRAVENASSAESDRYEELLVNPTLLLLTKQRGAIDCGGLAFLVVRYGAFFQLLLPTTTGHVSVAVEPDGDPVGLASRIQDLLAQRVAS